MRSLRELRILGEALAIIVVTWLLLGWFLVDRAITQADGSVLVMPLVRSALEAGVDWTDHLYRVGVIGGSKMHEFAGTMPIVQLCSLLGLSTTASVNLITIFVQLCFGYFGVVALQSLVTLWTPARTLTVAERAIAVASFAFMPLFAWRFALGHENLLLGLLPLWVTVALLLAARAKNLGATSLVLGAFAVANGVSGLGPQTVAYSVGFGTPLVLLIIVDAPRGTRWGRMHWIVVATLAAGVLVMLPRMAPMFAHAVGDDASRGLGESVKESFGTTAWQDWLGSLAWTPRIVQSWQGQESLHEHNFALGPLLVLLPLAWARGRRLVAGIGIGIVLAILFAQGVEPVASAFGFLDSFRVPARAVLAPAMFIALVALAAWFSRAPAPSARIGGYGVVAAAALVPILRHAPWPLVETLAWLGCIGCVAVLRWRPALLPYTTPVLALVAALGIAAFDARFPRNVPWDTIEHGPRELREAAILQAPELADPLHRVVVGDTAIPFKMSTAFAAGLGSLDGVWYPPKRFLELLSGLTGYPYPSTTCVFELGDSRVFAVFQQLYNVRYAISLGDRSFNALPPPIGAAWFPSELATIEDARGMAVALAAQGDFRPRIKSTGWVLRRDDTPRSVPAACAGAQVRGARSDGQAITIEVGSPADCVLVVATNYVSTLRATATVGGTDANARVFPIDVALTGISVPSGATQVVLAPHVSIPLWSRIAQLLGLATLIAALVATLGSTLRAQRRS